MFVSLAALIGTGLTVKWIISYSFRIYFAKMVSLTVSTVNCFFMCPTVKTFKSQFQFVRVSAFRFMIINGIRYLANNTSLLFWLQLFSITQKLEMLRMTCDRVKSQKLLLQSPCMYIRFLCVQQSVIVQQVEANCRASALCKGRQFNRVVRVYVEKYVQIIVTIKSNECLPWRLSFVQRLVLLINYPSKLRICACFLPMRNTINRQSKRKYDIVPICCFFRWNT